MASLDQTTRQHNPSTMPLGEPAMEARAEAPSPLMRVLHITEHPRDIFWLYRNLSGDAGNGIRITSAIDAQQAGQRLNQHNYQAVFVHCYISSESCQSSPQPSHKAANKNDTQGVLSTTVICPNVLTAINDWSSRSAVIAIIHEPVNIAPNGNSHIKSNSRSQSTHSLLVEQLLNAGIDDYISASDMTTPLLEKMLSYSVERKQANQHIALNTLDPSTQLPNQTYFEHALARHLRSQQPGDLLTAVLHVQLDHLKPIETTNTADALSAFLHVNGAKLQHTLRQNDTVACANNDGYLIMLNSMPNMETIIKVAAHVIESLGKAEVIHGATLFSTASIGISIQTPKNESAQELIVQARQATKMAQQQGGNRHCLFSLDQRVQASLNNQLTSELYKALQNEEFFLVFQPQMDVTHNRLHGAEVLLRWQHPTHKNISPASFIPILESTGLITPVTEWIINTAIKQWDLWRTQNIIPNTSHLSINLSPSFFQQASFKDFFTTLKALPQSLKDHVHFEITENLFVDPESNIEQLQFIRACGFKLSMDDFGTGYSSLSYLKHFPLDCIKLDCTFTKEIVENPTDLAITQAVINLSRDLEIDLIAEGVENEGTLALLKHMGCQIIQGYHFSKPLKADNFSEYCQKL